MAYTSGDTILDDHYNAFATSVNAVWGTGSGDSGYGQTNTVAAVDTSTTVQASQWTTLLARITSSASHQGSSITSITNPSAGDSIAAFTALSGNISTITSNRLNVSSRAGNATTSCSTTTNLTGTITQTGNWTWGSDAQARFFFNTGGRISCSWDVNGGSSNTKYDNWDSLATAMGTYQIIAQSSGKSGGSGGTSTNNTNLGWHDLTSSFQVALKQYEDTGPYTANYIQFEIRKDSGGVVYFQTKWVDDAADQASFNKSIYNSLDNVTGNKLSTFGHEESETSHIADTWGDGPTQNVTANG